MLPKLQAEMKRWVEYNFTETNSVEQFLGVVEEVGELAHAIVKLHQGIRGDAETLEAEERDAIGDIVIFLMNYCNFRGYDFEKIVALTWENVVSKRDWRQNKLTGGSSAHGDTGPQPLSRSDVMNSVGDADTWRRIAEAATEYITADLEAGEAEDDEAMGEAQLRAYEAYRNLVDIVTEAF